MDSRQRAFQKLRSPCVELSSVALKFKGELATNVQLLEALKNVHRVLVEVSQSDGLDSKLAEYCLFPLTPIFNTTQRASAQCLELSLRCLEILITKGWAAELQPALAKQLLIMMTLLAGGLPERSPPNAPRSEEMTVAAFDCIKAIFTALSVTTASTVLNEVAPATIIDQTVYVLLEGLMESNSDGVQHAAVQALIVLDSRITDRVVLASLLPRTVSSLTKVLVPTSEKRRAYFVLRECLHALRDVLQKAMNDKANKATESQEHRNARNIVLNDSWRKATAAQVKMALANVIRIRTHDRWDVREQLALLCETVCRECHDTLSESVPMLVETLTVLASVDDGNSGNRAAQILRRLLEESDEVRDILKSSVYSWTAALPRAIEENDFRQKERALQRVSFGFKSLNQLGIVPDLLDTTLANALCDTAAVLMKASEKAYRVEALPAELDLSNVKGNMSVMAFTPVTAESGQSAIVSSDLQNLIQQICQNDGSLSLAHTMLGRTLEQTQHGVLEPYWVLVTMLKATVPEAYVKTTSTADTHSVVRAEIWTNLVDELYSFSLPIVTEFSAVGEFDWRVVALALESVALQALQLGSQFAPELIDVLYPVLQVLATPNPMLKRHAIDCLNVIVSACGYSSASDLLVGNVDYLVNAVSLKLNAFDVSPQAPQVLLLMIQLCGPELIPFLDDLVASIFAILDAYHGYPKLAEVMFAVLRAIVAKGAQGSDRRLIADASQEEGLSRSKYSYQGRDLRDVVKSVVARRKRLEEAISFERQYLDQEEEEVPFRPLGPLSSDMLEEKPEKIEEDVEFHEETDNDKLPPPKEEEKKLSASHQLLLNIVKSIPPHLSSPSPSLRKSLLDIMQTSMTYLSHDENTFLPLINDLWPTVSARIALPATFSKHTSLVAADDSSIVKRSVIDAHGISEETYVFVDACSTIGAMIRTAKGFMAKRIEDELPRWKKMYERVWKEVKNDAQRSAQRAPARGSFTDDKLSASRQRQPLLTDKSYTPQHTIWRAFNDLFATILRILTLTDDISWEICCMLGETVSYLQPDLYSSNRWRGLASDMDRAVAAMDHYNRDLTWFIFQKAQRQLNQTSQNMSNAASDAPSGPGSHNQPSQTESQTHSDAPTVMPLDSAPSISNSIHEFVVANGLLSDPSFLDIILCSPEDIPELAAYAATAGQEGRMRDGRDAARPQERTVAAGMPRHSEDRRSQSTEHDQGLRST